MAAGSISLRELRAGAQVRAPRLGARAVGLVLLVETLLLLALFVFSGTARAAEPIHAEVSVRTGEGYARLVFKLSEESEADVRLANGIVVIAFKKPVDVVVDRLSGAAPAYIGAARRDPDGRAVRLALARKVTVNSMAAGEKLFVDLLPDTWTGVTPGLPQDVVEDLARRAREAEKKARAAQAIARQRTLAPIRVRVGTQPTFTRYVFELPEIVPVATDRDKDRLALIFEAPLKFDLADAQAALPPTIAALETEAGPDSTIVRFQFAAKADVRTFREDNAFVVDVSPVQEKAPPAVAQAPEPAQPVRPAETRRAPAPEHTQPPPAPAAVPASPAAAAETPLVPPQAPARSPVRAEAPARQLDPNAPVVAELKRQDGALRLSFPFAAPTAAAVFRRFDTVWLVFESGVDIDVKALQAAGAPIRNVTSSTSASGRIVRIKLDRPRLASAAPDAATWSVTLGDVVLDPTAPLTLVRNIAGLARASAAIALQDPARLHRIEDPEVGDTLLVVTAPAPARGFLRTLDFVEFRALASVHGIVIEPLADDVAAELAPDRVVITRPGGLTLSNSEIAQADAAAQPGYRPALFDPQVWSANRQAAFLERQSELMRIAASVPADRRTAARVDLARFYLGREFYPEAKSVLDVAVAGDRPNGDDISSLVMRAAANVMMARGTEALKDLSHPAVGNQADAALWRALAYMTQSKWSEARESFKLAEAAIVTLPVELQRIALREEARAAIEARDFAEASRFMHDLEAVEIPREMRPLVAVLSGRLAEGLGRLSDALAAYRSAAESPNRLAAAQGRLREIVLRHSMKETKADAAIAALEELTTMWRGDDTEIEALTLLAKLYTEEGRYRDAFTVMRTAVKVHPNAPMTRRIHDEAAATFDALFLANKGEGLPPIDALSLFYDFRELTPIGRRGDEMIRRLADRLVAVDLLDQAAELLQHQIDHRLQGAARAQVAVRLATVYLMNRKPDRALNALRTTRVGDLNNDLRNQRLLLEARALSDTGRHDLAMELVANLTGREVERLRADILWAAKRWREAAEQIEKLFGERWRDFAPLTEAERPDILRAAVAFVLGEDRIGQQRFRDKYAAKMAEGPDARLFAVITGPLGAASPEFREATRAAMSVGTLEAFLRDLRARFPDTPPQPAAAPAALPNVPSRIPPGPGQRAANEPARVAGR
jgi:tetratricopeptide (TPR) repeat protein